MCANIDESRSNYKVKEQTKKNLPYCSICVKFYDMQTNQIVIENNQWLSGDWGRGNDGLGDQKNF